MLDVKWIYKNTLYFLSNYLTWKIYNEKQIFTESLESFLIFSRKNILIFFWLFDQNIYINDHYTFSSEIFNRKIVIFFFSNYNILTIVIHFDRREKNWRKTTHEQRRQETSSYKVHEDDGTCTPFISKTSISVLKLNYLKFILRKIIFKVKHFLILIMLFYIIRAQNPKTSWLKKTTLMMWNIINYDT